MNDHEYRALIEYHARELSNLNEEPQRGFGLIKKLAIVERLRRMLQLAENLE
jgi:hypothetical protein